ncbi:hypothetical protein EG830_06645, partial [bacterium]|nr:hypothetical protein [bacterium]
MIEKGNTDDKVPEELERLLATDKTALDFFNSLSKSYKKGYCD